MGLPVPKWTYSYLHYHYLREALSTRAFYEYDTSGPDLIHRARRYNRLYVRYRLVRTDQSPGALLPEEKEDEQRGRLMLARNQLSDLDVDVLDILMSRWLSSRREQEQYVEVDTDEILFSRGLSHKVNGQGSNEDAHGRGYTPRQREAVNRAICRLLLLWGNVKLLHSHDAPNFEEESRVLDLDCVSWKSSSSESAPLVMHTRESSKLRKRHSIRFRPGKILRRCNLFQQMYQPTSIYQFNYRRYPWEKRLGRYLCWQWRILKNQDKDTLVKQVSTFLESILLNPSRDRYRLREMDDVSGINPDYRPSQSPLSYQVRRRLTKALDSLVESGLISEWHYGDGWDSSWSRKQNWGKLWRRSQLEVSLSDEIKDAYSSPESVGEADPSILNRERASGLLEAVLGECELTQTEVADRLDITQGYVSAIKNERTLPSPSLTSKIKDLADRKNINEVVF